MSIPVWWHLDQLCANPQHEWDKRGFRPHPETGLRVQAILETLRLHDDFYDERTPEPVSEAVIQAVHAPELLTLYGFAEELAEGAWYYPTSFPRIQLNNAQLPQRLEDTGYFCEDTSTWLCSATKRTVLASASCAYAGALWLHQSSFNRLGYALCRPPGHHAGPKRFGGYCYLNNSAIAAQSLLYIARTKDSHSQDTVSILDLDYHHGDGTQEIFYHRGDVQTVSIHADPSVRFPYFQGFPEETGDNSGIGANCNITLPPEASGEAFVNAVKTQAIPAVEQFGSSWIVVPFGADTLKDDTVGDFNVHLEHIAVAGELIGQLNRPTLVVQEGGYNPEVLGLAAHTLLVGIQRGQLLAQ